MRWLFCSLLLSTAAQAGEPRLVFIVADAMRADVVGAYGAHVPTPHLDALAARGVRFDRAYSTAPWTSPSSVGMFTGNYPSTYLHGDRNDTSGHWAYHVPDDEPMFAEALRDAGYTVTLKYENINMQRSNNAQGMDTLPEPGGIPADRKQAVVDRLGFKPYNMETKRMFGPLDFLLTAPDARPFALFIWITDPHNRYDPASPFVQMSPEGLPRSPEYYRSLVDPSEWESPATQLTPAELAYVKALYEGEVRSVDERVGTVMKALKLRGWLDDTVVVFTSDHGEAFGEQGLFAHGKSYYESMTRVPWIMAGPGVPKGLVVRDPVGHVDLLPTLHATLGVAKAWTPKLQGQSLTHTFQGKPAGRPVYLDGAGKKSGYRDGIVDGRYKLITRIQGPSELYDLTADPGETTNLAASKPDVVARLTQLLEAFRARNRALHATRTFPASDRASTEAELEALRALGYIE